MISHMIDISGFIIAILPIALSPGASFTLAMSNVAISGMQGVSKVIIGTGAGIVLHGLLVGLGISNILSKSPIIMNGLQIFGLIFLLWLGIKLVISGIKRMRTEVFFNTPEVEVKHAFLLNLFNVKAIVLYLTVVPIFAGTKLQNYLLLSTIHVAIMAMWIFMFNLGLCFVKQKLKINLISAMINLIGGLCLLYMSYHSALSFFSQPNKS